MKGIYFVSIAFIVAIGLHSCKNQLQKSVVNTNANDVSKAYFLFLSDVHLDVSREKTDSGNDTGMALWRNCKMKLDSIVKSNNPPRFVIYTGDLPAHGIRGARQIENVTKVLTDLQALLAPGKIPFLYAPGNNDALASNYASYSNQHDSTPFTLIHKSLGAFNVSETNTGSAYFTDTVHKAAGYYAAKVTNGLRVICLNTIIWGNRYEAADGIPQEEAGDTEMAWLAGQLQQANTVGDKVYLAMHIPPGTDAYSKYSNSGNPYMWKNPPYKQSWQNRFLQLVAKNQSTIAGIFFGHTHFDELRLLYDSAGNNLTQVAISCPGVSPNHDNNPAFKLVYFDAGKTKLPLNFTTYYTSRDAATWGNGMYNFAEVFGVNANRSMYENLKQLPVGKVQAGLHSIYATMSTQQPYDTLGLMVKWIQ